MRSQLKMLLLGSACVLSRFSHDRLFATPWTCQAPLSWGAQMSSLVPVSLMVSAYFNSLSHGVCLWLQRDTISLYPATLRYLSKPGHHTNIYGQDVMHSAEKAMAHHSSTPGWKIPWMEEPGGLQSMGLLRVGHN